MTYANPARGEVELELEGERYVMALTFGGAAKLQHALGIKGLVPIQSAIMSADPEVVQKAIELLATSGDTKKIADMPFHAGTVAKAVVALLELFHDPNAPPDTGARAAKKKKPTD